MIGSKNWTANQSAPNQQRVNFQRVCMLQYKTFLLLKWGIDQYKMKYLKDTTKRARQILNACLLVSDGIKHWRKVSFKKLAKIIKSVFLFPFGQRIFSVKTEICKKRSLHSIDPTIFEPKPTTLKLDTSFTLTTANTRCRFANPHPTKRGK